MRDPMLMLNASNLIWEKDILFEINFQAGKVDQLSSLKTKVA